MDPLTVQAAANTLDVSEATIRRMLKSGLLLGVVNDGPVRVDAASLEGMRCAKIVRLSGFVSQSAPVPHAGELEAAELEVDTLKQVVLDLRVAQAALLDAIGRLVEPAFPND